MRRALLSLFSLALIAASPATKRADELFKQGSDREAAELLARESARGDTDATHYIAWLYDNGKSVPRDLQRAAQLYRRAAEAGHVHAQWRLGVMLDLGEGVAADPSQAIGWFRKAADQGHAKALVSLGVMYATGRGVSTDYAESRRLYMEAGRRGEAHGYYGVAVLHIHGQGVPQNLVESLAWMLVAATLGDKVAQEKVPEYGLSSTDTRAAADRANQIRSELGLTGPKVIFRDIDAERAASEAQ